jgi:hypothetical protein
MRPGSAFISGRRFFTSHSRQEYGKLILITANRKVPVRLPLFTLSLFMSEIDRTKRCNDLLRCIFRLARFPADVFP